MEFNLEKLHAAITDFGYFFLNAGSSESVPKVMHELACTLGGAFLAGRGGNVLETLNSLEADEAPPRSLSRFSGVGAQPWHVDGSHLTVPPRYVILGCQTVTGPGAPPTQLLRIKDAGFPHPVSHCEIFVVKNGRSSFYSTISNTDRPWIRFDPGCMSARTEQGRTMLEAASSVSIQPYLNLEWTAGGIIIIDNWAVLHRRGHASGLGQRTLLRISLKG